MLADRIFSQSRDFDNACAIEYSLKNNIALLDEFIIILDEILMINSMVWARLTPSYYGDDIERPTLHVLHFFLFYHDIFLETKYFNNMGKIIS